MSESERGGNIPGFEDDQLSLFLKLPHVHSAAQLVISLSIGYRWGPHRIMGNDGGELSR